MRQKSGLTQEELASRLGATQSFVSKCERGERRIDVIELARFCKAMGIRLPDFVALLAKALESKGH
jgi:transcriptional regulator with XRE-family HTH domain